MNDSAPSPWRRTMGITHGEFLRSLPPALKGAAFTTDGPRITIPWPPGVIHITLGPQGSRRLGSLSLPATEVEIRFEGLSQEQADAFLQGFQRAFQRGGG